MRLTETVVQLVDFRDFGKSFGAPADRSEKDGAIFVRATVTRRQSDGAVELAIGSFPIPIECETQLAEGVVGFPNAVVKFQCLG